MAKLGEETKLKLYELLGWVCLGLIGLILALLTGEINPFLLALMYVFLVMVPIAYYVFREDRKDRNKTRPRKILTPELAALLGQELPPEQDAKPDTRSPLEEAVGFGVITTIFFWCLIAAPFVLVVIVVMVIDLTH
jgi:hypothetical protein